MKQTAIFPGRYVQSADALQQLGDEMSGLGNQALIVAGKTSADSIIPPLLGGWRERFELAVESFAGECTDGEIERLTAIAEARNCDVVIAMGGGKVIDTVKAVGYAADCKTVIAPTIASTDAPTSAVSVIYTEEGAFSRYLFLPRNPDLVLVDTSIISQAPERFLVAGMGDALATWFEADACRQAFSNNQCGGLATLAAQNLARLCYDTILEFGVAAKVSCQQQVVTPALSHVVEANTLLSGLGFESGGLASAHSIHNGLTQLAGTHDYYQGEKVAIGVLAGLFLADQPAALIDEVYDFCESIGLPTTLADIGVVDPTEEELQMVAAGACSEGETIHNEPSPISTEAVVAAIKTADCVGQQRLDDA